MSFDPHIRAVPPPDALLAEASALGLPPAAVWTGEPVDAIQVDLRRGGVGDALLTLAVARAAHRAGRTGRLRLHLRSGFEVLLRDEDEWVATEPDSSLPLLPALHVLVRHRYRRPSAPLTLLAMRCLDIDPAALAGPVVRRPAPQLAKILIQIDEPPESAVPSPWNQFKHIKSATVLMRQLAQRLAPDLPLAVIGHGSEAIPGTEDLRQLDLGGLAGAIASSPLVISCDSGPQHLAAMLGTPGIALYGPSDPALHACARSTVPISGSCSVGPCGAGSSYGMPLEAGPVLPGHGALAARPFPCPGSIGACLTGLELGPVVATVRQMLTRS